MPRKDRTFTDSDLVRCYCKNLDQAEKARMLATFRSGKQICPDDPPAYENLCSWAKAFQEVTQIAEVADFLVKDVLKVLVAIEAILAALSWFGWWGKLLKILQIAMHNLIAFVIFLGALAKLVAELGPLATVLINMFCGEGDPPKDLPEPPNPEDMPENPADWIENLEQDIEDWFGWALPGDDDPQPEPPDSGAWPPGGA